MAINEAIRVSLLMDRAIGRNVKTLIQRLFRKLIEETPVRSGWAQSNWLISVGTPPEDPVGSPKAVDYGPQKNSLRTIRGYKPEQGELFLYNNVPYIGLLEQGYSPQAPAGFVEDIIDQIIREVEKVPIRDT